MSKLSAVVSAIACPSAGTPALLAPLRRLNSSRFANVARFCSLPNALANAAVGVDVDVAGDSAAVLAEAGGRGTAEASAAAWAALDLFFLCLAARGAEAPAGEAGLVPVGAESGEGAGAVAEEARRKVLGEKVGREADGVGAWTRQREASLAERRRFNIGECRME